MYHPCVNAVVTGVPRVSLAPWQVLRDGWEVCILCAMHLFKIEYIIYKIDLVCVGLIFFCRLLCRCLSFHFATMVGLATTDAYNSYPVEFHHGRLMTRRVIAQLETPHAICNTNYL